MPDAIQASSTNSPRLTATHTGALRLLVSTVFTYLRRPWLWTWPLGVTLLTIFVSSKISPMYDAHSTGLSAVDPLPYEGLFFSTFLLGCSAGFLAASVTGHFVQLLAPPRGHLVPRLRRTALTAHVLLTALIVLGLATIWPHPTVTYTDSDYHAVTVSVPLHALALATVLIAQLAWTQFAPVTGAFSLFTWGILSFPSARLALLRMLIGQAPGLEGFVVILAVGLLVALWIAIARRRDRPLAIDPIVHALVRPFLRDDAPRAARTPSASGAVPALAAPRAFNVRARLRLHRHATTAGYPAAVTGLLVGVLLVLWVLSFGLLGFDDPDPTVARLLGFMTAIIPVMLVTATAMENRGPLLTQGLLLPTSRRQFVRELGLAMLANIFTNWFCALLPILAWAAFLAPERARPTPAALAAMTSIAAAYQLLAFGATAWILRLTHRIAITFSLAGLCSLGVLIMIDATLAHAAVTITITTILACAGLAFTLTAYARWSSSEPPSAGPSKTAAAL
jgi:hypothetical protein